jgi:hypothetical protein
MGGILIMPEFEPGVNLACFFDCFSNDVITRRTDHSANHNGLSARVFNG